MMMYLTYQEYQDYGGTLTEAAFNANILEAEEYIDYETFNRLKDDTEFSEDVKRCCFKLVNMLERYNNYIDIATDVSQPFLSGASNDGVSANYGGYLGSTSPSDMKTVENNLQKSISRIIHRMLYGEKNQKGEILLYRGVYK